MRRFLTIFLTISFFSVAYTQSYDEVSTGAQYSQQAYYNLSTGSVQIVNNNAWDIAFSNIGQTDAGIFINEAASLAENPVKLFVALDNDWSTPITDASIFIDDVQLFNSENNWTIGAFNETRNPDDPTDFGWGQYNPQNHQIIGNEVYVVKKRNGDFIKFKVDAYRNGYYHFRYANLDNSNEVQDSVARNTNGPKSLVHYSFDSKGIVKIDNGY
ncbi:MAG TPA: HmuY family protein, partial [Saprospiraceae bacterium]|nr:HmuY family protein [Saprospiraceae bacterium]